jgi:hypothetical protein
MRKSERKKQPAGFSSSQAKMARTKDDDDEEDLRDDAEMTLNRYLTPAFPIPPSVSALPK